MRWIIVTCVVVLAAALGGVFYLLQPSPEKVRGADSQKVQIKVFRVEGDKSGSAGEERTASRGRVAPEDRYENGEVVVVNPPQGFASISRQLGFRIIETVSLRELDIVILRLRIPSGATVPVARRQLAGRFPGIVIDANHLFETQGVEDYPDQLPRALIGWTGISPNCGSGIRLGMIDSRLDLEHPALAGQKIEFRSFHKAGRRPGPADHGTAIAAMLVGKPKWGGLMPGAELKAANMFEINETGRVVGNAMGLLKAVNWMAQKRVHVVNLSVAGADNKVVRTAFERARKKGLIMIAAAGNGGSKAKPAYPAAYKHVTAVTAFDVAKHIYGKANQGSYIDFTAPGVKVYTAVPGGGRIQSGTSFATPYITVLIAIEVWGGAARDSNALRGGLRKKSVDLGTPGRDKVFGWGEVETVPSCAP